MDTSQKMFLLAVEEMNFTKAAHRAYVTQQCLSEHIRNLEKTLGTQLFFRTPRLQLTPSGKVRNRPADVPAGSQPSRPDQRAGTGTGRRNPLWTQHHPGPAVPTGTDESLPPALSQSHPVRNPGGYGSLDGRPAKAETGPGPGGGRSAQYAAGADSCRRRSSPGQRPAPCSTSCCAPPIGRKRPSPT